MKRIFTFLASLAGFLTYGQTTFTEYRYWIDSSYSAAITTPISGSFHQGPLFVNLSTLSPGPHTISFAYHDNGGRWSVPITESFVKRDTGLREIVAYRYWFNSDFRNAVDSMLASPVQTLALDPGSLHLSTLQLPLHTTDTLHVQFRDDNGRWSVSTSDTFNRCGLISTLVLDTLVHNPNEIVSNVMRGATIHRYYLLRTPSGMPVPDIPVRFIARSGQVPDSIFIDAVSGQKGLVDVRLNLGGKNPGTAADDLFQASSNVVLAPYSIGSPDCSTLSSASPAWLKSAVVLSPWAGQNGSVGLSLMKHTKELSFGSLSGIVPMTVKPLQAGLTGGLAVTLRSTAPYTYEADLEGTIGVSLAANFGVKTDVFDVSLLKGDATISFTNKLIDYRLNAAQFADWFWYYWYLLLSRSDPHNVEYNNMMEAAYSYARDRGAEEPVYHTLSSLSLGLNASAGISFSPLEQKKDSDKWTFSLPHASAGAAFKLSREWSGNSVGTKLESRSATVLGSVDVTLIDANISSLHNRVGAGFTQAFRIGHRKDLTLTEQTGTIEFESSGDGAIMGLDGEVSVATKYVYKDSALHLFTADLGSGKLSNPLANYISDAPGNLGIVLKTGASNGLESAAASLQRYFATAGNPGWAGDELTRTTDHTVSGALDIERGIHALRDILGFGGSFKLPYDLAVNSSLSYPRQAAVYNISMDSMLVTTEYFQTAPQFSLYPGAIWDELSAGMWDWLKSHAADLQQSFFEGVNAAGNRVSGVVGATRNLFSNARRKLNNSGFWKTADASAISMRHFSKLVFEIPGSDSAFAANSSFLLSYYFPKGRLLSATILGDTCVLVSDLFLSNAKDASGNELVTSPNGTFRITASVGADDMRFFGLDTLDEVSLLHKNYTDTLWEVLGTASINRSCTVAVNQLGQYALGKVFGKDTLPPVITFQSLPSGDTVFVTITDQLSGVDWSRCFYQLNGEIYPVNRIGLTNSIQIPIPTHNSTGPDIIGVHAADLQGNKDYELLSLTTDVDNLTTVRSFLLTAYPNPASESITVMISGKSGLRTHLKMFDAMGKLVRSTDLEAASDNINKHLIDISSLPAGMYTISATNGVQAESLKIVVRN